MYDVDGRRMCVRDVNAKLKKLFSKRKLFDAGYYEIDNEIDDAYGVLPWKPKELN